MSRPDRLLPIALLLAALAALPVAATDPAAGPDVEALLRQAGQSFDLEHEDAVLLLDAAREEWRADGRRIASVHRIVYLRTELAIDDHADLRIPYDGAHQRMTVTALRTWRLSDRRWVASGPTARVETLPFAVDHAPDYADRREMMLLHDGVELPCVLETAYTLEDVAPYRPGSDGLWTLAREEPALRSELVLAFPPEAPFRFSSPIEAERGRDERLGLDTLTFAAGPLEPLPRPHTAGEEAREPHVAWSTWPSWAALGTQLERAFAAGAALDEPLRATASERLRDARTPAEKVRLVAAFVADATRSVEVERGWWTPRPAARTWATAYGDRLDRAVLAAALLRDAGIAADLAFRGRSWGVLDAAVATTALLDGPALWVRGDGVEGWLDPATDTTTPGLAAIFGRAVWRPAVDREPVVRAGGTSRLALRLDLSWDSKTMRWSGTGVLTASGALCPFERMAGLGSETLEYLKTLGGAALPGASVTGASLEAFGPAAVTAGFTFELGGGERDPLDRLRLLFGDPEGLATLLAPSEVRTSDLERASGVELPGPVAQSVELRLELGGLKPLYLPEERRLATSAGSFELTAEHDGDRVSLSRTLRLERQSYDSKAWPGLRALLLADAHERGRTVLLE